MLLPESTSGNLWAIVLAGGGGKRISQFVEHCYGVSTPKQYVAFTGKRSMLQHTVDRVEKLISAERIRIVADRSHFDQIRAQLSGKFPGGVVFQPTNRETAPGVLLPLLEIYKRDPAARVAIFPSDHFVREEDLFMGYVALGDRAIQRHPEKIVILGIRAEEPETDYGWIEPGGLLKKMSGLGVRRVVRFLEKPDSASAMIYYKKGFLWNTFVTLTKARTLLRLAQRHLPRVWDHFKRMIPAIGTDKEASIVESEYRFMQGATLSHGILERCPSRISVIEVKNVFWSDWGTSDRVISTLKRIGKLPAHLHGIAPSSGCSDFVSKDRMLAI